MTFTEFSTRLNQVLQIREEFVYVKIDYLVHGLGQVGNVDYGLTYLYDGTPKNMLFLPTLVPLKAVDEQLCSSLVEVFAQAAGAVLVEGSAVYALSRPDVETCLRCIWRLK